MSDGEVIECRPTRWFYLRAGAMVLMFTIFFGLFMKDWKIGYPKKNEVFYTFGAFEAAKEAFRQHEEAAKGAEAWESWAAEQKIPFPDEEGVLPAGVDKEAGWPSVLTDYEGYKSAYAEEANKATPPLWASYTDERGWSSAKPEKAFTGKKVREQLIYGIGSGVLMLIGLFFLVRTSRRCMKADAEAYYAPDGTRIPYAEMETIDKRKWETKGLASITYESGGVRRKAKVDGMVYGQFKKEEGAPAEALFARILENFSGDLLELVEDEEEAGSGAETSDAGDANEGDEEPAGEEDEGKTGKDLSD